MITIAAKMTNPVGSGGGGGGGVRIISIVADTSSIASATLSQM